MKKIIALALCAALCLGLAPSALAEGDTPTIQYAAVTGTEPDHSDAAIVTAGLDSWTDAAAVENCVFVVVYSLDAAGAPPTLNADIDLSQPGPGLILSDVKIEGSARAEAGLFILGDASVVWGNATLSGSSASGNPLPPLTETANAGDILAAAEGAKTRHTYTADEDIGMLSAYDLVINPGVTLTVRAPEPESEGTHCVTVERSLTVKSGGRLTAEDGQRLELGDGATVTGLTLYEQDGEGSYRGFTLNGAAEFVFDADAVYDPDGSNITGLWVRSEGGGDPGPGPGPGPEPGGEPCAITVTAGENGSISPAGEVTVSPGEEFTITPEAGYAVESVTMSIPPYGDADTEDIMRNLSYNGDGAFTLTLWDVLEGMKIDVTFAQESQESIDELLDKSYCILEGEVDRVETALAREFGYLGYAIGTDRIAVSNINTDDITTNGYGTFEFTVDGMPSEKATGYIVKNFSDVIFRYDGKRGGEPVNRICVAKAADGALGEFGAPAMDDGTMEAFGVYNARIAGLISQDVRDAMTPDNRNSSRQRIAVAFYRAQLHIVNSIHDGASSLNWFMFDLIQDDALCVGVSASSARGEQRTFQWELNRYAQLTTGSYVSEIYFANDEVSLSLPSSGIGGANSLSMTTGEFPGYRVINKGSSIYTVEFLSNFYNEITLDLTINGTEIRQITIRRVGVYIADYQSHQNGVFHGTQYGTRIDHTGGMNYHIYATYYIPDGGTAAPYGLFVTYTWANGATTSEIIATPASNPFHAGDFPAGDGFQNGVFLYNNRANASDYLLYAGPNAASAPRRVSVTVLRNEPGAETFGGVSFGSGAGVTWTRGQ